MTLGLLVCDHVPAPLLPAAGGDYDRMFADFLPQVDWKVYDVINGVFPARVDDCAAYVCTGSKHSVYDDLPWIRDLQRLVRDIQAGGQAYLGVCFGHQLLAEALGGKVERARTGWCVGAHRFTISRREAWMTPYQNHLQLLMSCQDQVARLPTAGVVLGHTPTCPVGLFRVGERMLGIQGHPEFSKTYTRALLESRRERLGEDVCTAGIDSLDQPLDAGVVAEWVMRFLMLRS